MMTTKNSAGPLTGARLDAAKTSGLSPPDEEAIRVDEQLWRADDVASYLKCSKSFVYKQAEAGLLPCLRIGAMLRFEPKAVRAFAVGDR